MPRSLRETLLPYAPAAILVAAGLLAYSNAYSCVFVFDGVKFVRDSSDIRQLWPPVWARANTRPVAMLTFALNYAVHGTEVWGYHAVNIAIHVAAGLLLFGIVRRTLEMQPRFAGLAVDPSEAGPRRRKRKEVAAALPSWNVATWLALAAALLWTVHPLQTQSVTYLYQRFESLMGLLVLASVYAFIRGASGGDSPNVAGTLRVPSALLHPPSEWVGCGTGRGGVQETDVDPQAALPARSSRPVQGEGNARSDAQNELPSGLLHPPAGRVGRGSGRGGVRETAVDPQAALPARSSRPSRGEGDARSDAGNKWHWAQPSIFWYAASAACCLLAMGTKETAAVVPLVLLWYDRAFLAGSWREVIRRRGVLHGPLLAVLLGGVGYVVWNQAWYAGGGILAYDEVSTLEYAQSQPGVILHYLRLTFWPVGQCLDYGWPVARTAWQIVPPLLAVGLLLGLTAWAAWRQPALGFLGGWFFLFLAPTSSFAPIIDLAFEHRMYLPLAAVAVLAVLGFHRLAERALRLPRWTVDKRQVLQAVVVGVAVVALIIATHRRNVVYRSEVAVWTDVVAKAPGNARGHHNLAGALAAIGDYRTALRHSQVAMELAPRNPTQHAALATAFEAVGDYHGAVRHFQTAVHLEPNNPQWHIGLAIAFEAIGDFRSAERHSRIATKLEPDNADWQCQLAKSLEAVGDYEDARKHYQRTLTLEPAHLAARTNFAAMLAKRGEVDAAITLCRKALELKSDHLPARLHLGNLLAATQPHEAIAHLRRALELDPKSAEAHNGLGNLLAEGNPRAALDHYQAALDLMPDYAEAHFNLANLLVRHGQPAPAIVHLREAVRLRPGWPEAEQNLRILSGAR